MVLRDRNARTPYGEIDLVMFDRGELVAVEVKARRSQTFGGGEMAITERKLAHMTQALLWYLETSHWHGTYRLDVVLVAAHGRRVAVRHLTDIAGQEA